MELAEPAAEAGVCDEAAGMLADEGGADEERGVVWREAEEDLFRELVLQRRRGCHPDDWRRRRRGFWLGDSEVRV